jgi:hypothetical protein
MAASNYLENALLDYVLRNTGTPTTTNVYLALYTTDPTDADSGTEVSTGAYARQLCAFDAASGGVTQNTALESFTASGASWGSIAFIGIHDALTTGNLLYHTNMTTSRTINDGDTLEFAIGSVTVTLT